MGKEFEIGRPIAYYSYGEWTPLCDCQGGSLSIRPFEFHLRGVLACVGAPERLHSRQTRLRLVDCLSDFIRDVKS